MQSGSTATESIISNCCIALSQILAQNVAALHEFVSADKKRGSSFRSFSDIHFDRMSDIIGSDMRLHSAARLARQLFESPRILMLFIERGIDEAIVVGDTVVRVLEVGPDEVRLAISSPDGFGYREVVLQCPNSEEANLLFSPSYDESLAFFA